MLDDETKFLDFTTEHLEGAVELSQQVAWPHRVEDWALIHSLSTGFAAVCGGRLIGTIFMTPYGDVATINMVLVEQSLRGRGLGRKLMDFAIDAAQGRRLRLTATAEGLPLYEKLGFVRVGGIMQHQGPVAAVPAPRGVEWAASGDFAEIVSIDRAASGMDRENLFAHLEKLGRFAVVRREGRVAGFVSIRTFGRGMVVGPCAAPSPEDAKALLSFVASGHQGEFLRVDTPDASGLSPWLSDLGLAHVGGGIAMVKGQVSPPSKTFVTYALASQALG